MTIISGKQSLGQRANQEDAFEIVLQNEQDPNSDILMLVADGMGGHAGGEVASNLALQSFKQHFISGSSSPKPRQRLQDALHAANDALRQRINTNPDLKGMGCTLLCSIKIGDRLIWVSVGDSVLFLLRKGHLKRLNADHSLYGELLQMVEAGKISQAEADTHPRRNALRSAVMGEKLSLVDLEALTLEPDDLVVLATDGLETLSDREIQHILLQERGADVRSIASDLLNAVEAKGKAKQDNTTIIVYTHAKEGMSNMLRGSQWKFATPKRQGALLAWAGIGTVAIVAGLITFVVSIARTPIPDPKPEQAPVRQAQPQDQPAAQERQIGGATQPPNIEIDPATPQSDEPLPQIGEDDTTPLEEGDQEVLPQNDDDPAARSPQSNEAEDAPMIEQEGSSSISTADR